MKFDITPQDLEGMIQRLRQWSQQLSTIRNSMQSYSQTLRQTWRDPQFESYVSNVEMMSKSLGLNSTDMEQTAKTLFILKQNLERTQQEYQRMIRQMQR
jgi:methyl-accepting chemotaxis protein